MFDIGYWEILFAALLLFIFFGHKLPKMMRAAGRAIVKTRPYPAEAGRQIAIDVMFLALLLSLLVLAILLTSS